jgi:hypothetical protein
MEAGHARHSSWRPAAPGAFAAESHPRAREVPESKI